MIIFVFGNLDVPDDALPLKILPRLKENFPNIVFKTVDPNEKWDIQKNMVFYRKKPLVKLFH